MACERLTDERLQADKMDLLYGEADEEVRSRVRAHLEACAACRQELEGLSRLRRELRAWQLPRPRAVARRREIVLPRWLAAAAVLLLGISVGLGGSAYVSLRRSLAEQSARAQRLEQRQGELARALQTAGAGTAGGRVDEELLLARLDSRIDERLRSSEARQERQLELRLADWTARSEAQRRVDLARVAAGLSYLDGRHGRQLARTNELMSYVLDTAGQRR